MLICDHCKRGFVPHCPSCGTNQVSSALRAELASARRVIEAASRHTHRCDADVDDSLHAELDRHEAEYPENGKGGVR